MSNTLIARSPDLTKLRNEGYDVEVRNGFLLVKNVPYVNSKRDVLRGILISSLTLAGDITTTPDTHAAFFAGEHPCHRDGALFTEVVTASAHQTVGVDVAVDHNLSAKPAEPHRDYYEKMNALCSHFLGPCTGNRSGHYSANLRACGDH